MRTPPNIKKKKKGMMHVDIVERYEQRICNMYLQTHTNVSPDKVKELVHKLTVEKLRNIPCKMHNNVTHEMIDTSVIDMFDWIDTHNPIITGNGTFFKQHAEYKSPEIDMLEFLQKDRDAKKADMYNYKKGSIEYTNRNVGQMNVKVVMNADYGGSGTTLSPFYSCYIPAATTASAKNLTTTLICCLELMSGNDDQWAKLNGINELLDMIFIILREDVSDRDMINDSYTVDEVCNWLVSKANNISLMDVNMLKTYLHTLKPNELTKLMLAFNPRLVLNRYLSGNVATCMNYLKAHRIDINNMTKESIHAAGYGVKAPEEIAGEIEYISKVIVDNCVYPFIPNDAEVRANNMRNRLIVCVTDTDSLMVHFPHYIDDFQARVETHRDSCLIASAFGMRLFIEHVIPKMVENITINCNINDKYYRDKFIFKNEYAFLCMALFAKKMYAESMFVQEGKPRNPHEIAVTGLSFKKRNSAEFLEPVMLDLYDRYVLTNEHVDVSGILDEVYALRSKLQREIGDDPSYYKVLSLKDIGSYDASKVLPEQMRGAIVWNNIMPDEEMLPMDRVIVIPLSFELLHKHANEDYRIAEVLRISLIDNPKEKTDPVICLPEYYHTIPDWIKPVIDKEYAIDKLLSPIKQLLGLFDVNIAETRGGILPSRMIFI